MKKNILLIFTDQQRADTIEALGNPIIKTPALNQLVEDGVAFINAYSPCPVCVAARHALVTGRMPNITGSTDNGKTQYRKSFMEILGENGYQTFGVGKMHFTLNREQEDWGFQKRKTSEARAEDDYEVFVRENGYGYVGGSCGEKSEMYYIPQPSQLPQKLDESTWVTDNSIQMLEERDKNKPFFMMTSFQRPHPPFTAPFPFNRLYRCAEMIPPNVPDKYENLLCYFNKVQNRYKYRDQGIDDNLVRTMKAYYYGSISFIDYNLLNLFSYLKENDLYDDTLIIFSSDHGELLGDYHSFGKRCFLDGSARIPMIIKYPGCQKGTRISTPVTLVDIMPTILKYADIDTDVPMDGEDLISAAEGKIERKTIYGQFQKDKYAMYMAMDESFKYIYSVPDQKEWLFDKKRDPFETRSLAQNPLFLKKTEEMRKRIEDGYLANGGLEQMEDGKWKKREKSYIPEESDAHLLFQDKGEFHPDSRYFTDVNLKRYFVSDWYI